MTPVTGLLYSQIGYDLGLPKRAIVRGPLETLRSPSHFTLHRKDDPAPLLQGVMTYWGELWGSAWWIADFSEMDTEGEYVLVIYEIGNKSVGNKSVGEGFNRGVDGSADDAFDDQSSERFRSAPFRLGSNLLWNATWRLVAIDQGERRARLAKEHVGWYDAGTAWQEANSHAALVVGLCDALEFAAAEIPASDLPPLEKQVLNGCDYLARLQDRATQLPNPVPDSMPTSDGAVVHQIWRFDTLILPGDTIKAALAWGRAARTLSDVHAAKRAEYLERARRALLWLRTATPLGGGTGFSAINHGAPKEAPVPVEWMTRDLLQHLWACLELTRAGADDYQDECVRLATKILERQIEQHHPEGVYYGHFRTFDSADYTEKAWIHHGAGGYGADCGGTFPHYLLPLIQMCELWPDHPQSARWHRAIHAFAYGYFLPACRANPFLLLPLGYFQGQGLLWFAGLWHGMNGAYGLAAALALEFARLFDDTAFRDIAVGNLQWIAGLNAGVTAESLFASHMYSRDIPPGVALPCSMIQGVGTQQAGNWMQIRGSICNGFSVGDQFRFDVEPTADVDGPHAFTDEDWITHAGAWLSGLARFQSK